MHAILKSVFLYLIENVSKIIVWNSSYVNLVNNNAIEVNFDDLLLEVYLFLVRKFDLVNMNSVDLRPHSLYIKLINVYDLNRETRFREYINLQCIFDWYSFIWFIHESVHLQSCDDSRSQFIWYCIIRIVNDIQNHVGLDEINVLENCSCSIRDIRFESVEHRRSFYRTNMIKKRVQLIWTLNEKVVVDRTYSVFNNAFHAMF